MEDISFQGQKHSCTCVIHLGLPVLPPPAIKKVGRSDHLVKSPELLSPCRDSPALMLSGQLSCSLQQSSVSLNSPRSSSLLARLPFPHHWVPATIGLKNHNDRSVRRERNNLAARFQYTLGTLSFISVSIRWEWLQDPHSLISSGY
jgi:hypothetical protein